MLTNKEISCVELTNKYLTAIEKENAELNAYVNITEDTALATAKSAANAGIDGIIIQDLGLASLIRKASPQLPLHASTQCSIRTPEQARWLESLGFSRLILERELSLDQIRAIRAAVSCELEFFVHGAICVCYNGQCYLSEKIAGIL